MKWKAIREDGIHEVSLATWVMRDGTEIKVTDMDDEHLLHTIQFLERKSMKADKYVSVYDSQEPGMFDGDFDVPSRPHPMFQNLCDEAQKRGLMGKEN